MAQKTKALPSTSYTILGLLTAEKELSGYDIRQLAQGMKFFYWSPAQSQVYSELRRLEERGYVLSRIVEQEGKPDKRLYRITVAGVDEFRRWMAADELGTTPIMKHPVLLKLYFGHASTPKRLIEMLEQYLQQTEDALGQLAIVQEFLDDDPTLAYPALVAEWGSYHRQAELAMTQKVIERLQNQVNKNQLDQDQVEDSAACITD